MQPALGHLAPNEELANFLEHVAKRDRPPHYSQGTAQEIDLAVRHFVGQSCRQVSTILSNTREVLEQGAQQLLEREMLDEEALRALAGRLRSPAA